VFGFTPGISKSRSAPLADASLCLVVVLFLFDWFRFFPFLSSSLSPSFFGPALTVHAEFDPFWATEQTKPPFSSPQSIVFPLLNSPLPPQSSSFSPSTEHRSFAPPIETVPPYPPPTQRTRVFAPFFFVFFPRVVSFPLSRRPSARTPCLFPQFFFVFS